MNGCSFLFLYTTQIKTAQDELFLYPLNKGYIANSPLAKKVYFRKINAIVKLDLFNKLHLNATLTLLFIFCASMPAFAVVGTSYKVKLKGVKNRALKNDIKQSAQCFVLEKQPPATWGQLQYRMKDDEKRIKTILISKGYYNATVRTQLDKKQQPALLYFHVDLGPLYHFGKLKLSFLNDPFTDKKRPKLKLPKKKGAQASLIFEEQKRVIDLLRHEGYPFPLLEKRAVSVDQKEKLVHVQLVFNPGEKAHYGSLKILGLKTLNPSFISDQVPWKTGDSYSEKQIRDFEKELLESGQFGTVRVEVSPIQEKKETFPVKIEVTQRKPRTIRLGVGYSDIGPSTKAMWTHRNLWGNGEKLQLKLTYSPIEWGLETSLERPHFLVPKQTLIFELDAHREQTDAYDADRFSTGLILKREIYSKIYVGTGIRYKLSQVDQLQNSEHYNHLIFPLFVTTDRRNSELNPTKGSQFFAQTSYYANLKEDTPFLKTELEGRLYYPLWERIKLSGAVRGTIGMIAGSSVENIPPDDRFYAGGGGSVRGYEYQSIGPHVAGTPTGGKELAVFSVELRMKPGKSLGYVAFLDGGGVYDDWSNANNQSLHYGAGIGLRWFTSIGPLRFDVAYPLNPSAEQVERIQFYISLGQAF